MSNNFIPPLIGGFPLYIASISSELKGSPRLLFKILSKVSSEMMPKRGLISLHLLN
jgi:hypothetical protein